MNESYILRFATGNEHKFQEATDILSGFKLKQVDIELMEIMEENLETIAKCSVEAVPQDIDRPVFVEDSGLFIESLDGFPGSISGYVHDKLGNQRILHLLEGEGDRSAHFESVVALQTAEGRIVSFSGRVHGRIAEGERGTHGFDYDSIFIPEGEKTLAEMTTGQKNEYSHRGRALEKLKDFLCR